MMIALQVYGLSKLMNIMWAKALNEKLKGTGVEAFSAHPGREVLTYRRLYSIRV